MGVQQLLYLQALQTGAQTLLKPPGNVLLSMSRGDLILWSPALHSPHPAAPTCCFPGLSWMFIHDEFLWKTSVGAAAFAQKYGRAALSLGLGGQ